MASKLFSASSLRASKVARQGPSTLLRQGFATASEVLQPQTKVSRLANGLTIATEANPALQTATVGMWINAGSRAETAANNGAAHFLEHMSFKGTAKRSQRDLEMTIENMGAHLNAYTSREQTVYFAKAFRSDVPASVEILSDILQNSTLSEDAIERERDVINREQQEVDKVMEEVVFDHLHATAFQTHSLGRTILGPKENINTLSRTDLKNYISTNYAGDRMVLVGSGAVEHEKLVELAEKHFGQLKANSIVEGSDSQVAPSFTGSEVLIRNDDMDTTHIALAVEGVSWSDPDYFTALLMQAIIGNWDRSLGAAANGSSRLSQIVGPRQLANSYMSFNTSYSDTGLWGLYLTSQSRTHLDDLVYFALKEWSRLYVSVSESEVTRAKQQLKAALVFGLDGTTAVAEDIGRQMLTSGNRMLPSEIAAKIDAITVSDVRRVAGEKLWDREVAVVGVGAVEGMPDFNRIRGWTSWNRV
ncbi:mitochondrial processing peptidase beta subunit [Dimargaris cristalligena]|uniref:mitochondrial processing peptidase n=1 Tax=Dimargaris cristalligena TaxID=215637 RepID=A0A4P9ZZA4_9FUNG|nr:mitochondrial processing peptidase beta subunit [Dimargaris cristalligena]|eukprot:RKP39104.1 mitochondrial processing peptidase beta subunit [Dimargaris cristalligena]